MELRGKVIDLKNNSDTDIVFDGNFTVNKNKSECIWDTVKYKKGITDNLQSVINNLAVFNQYVADGSLSLIVSDSGSTTQYAGQGAFDLMQILMKSQATMEESSVTIGDIYIGEDSNSNIVFNKDGYESWMTSFKDDSLLESKNISKSVSISSEFSLDDISPQVESKIVSNNFNISTNAYSGHRKYNLTITNEGNSSNTIPLPNIIGSVDPDICDTNAIYICTATVALAKESEVVFKKVKGLYSNVYGSDWNLHEQSIQSQMGSTSTLSISFGHTGTQPKLDINYENSGMTIRYNIQIEIEAFGAK